MLTVKQIIDHLDLQPLPVEGGLFRQTYCSEEIIPKDSLPDRYQRDKAFSTAIFYLLTSDPDSFSAMHTLPTDEIYHFYLGDPVEMLLLYPRGESQRIILGQEIHKGHHLQFVVPRSTWQGSCLQTGGHFALLGTTMAPGFDPQDYMGGEREELIQRYPDQAELINKLTRLE